MKIITVSRRTVTYTSMHIKINKTEEVMNVLVWIIFGGIAGWIASKIAGTDAEQGILANIIVGIIGAMIGGFLMQNLGAQGVTGFNLASFFVAILGAVILLVLLKALF